MASTAPIAPADEAATSAAADTLLRTFARIRRAGRRQSGRPVELGSLTTAQLELLRLVKRRPGISVAEAARELRLAANTVSTLVRELSDRGMLMRRASEADRRVAELDLEPDIREQIDAWRDRRLLALAAAIDELPSDEQDRLLDAVPLLEAVADRLEQGGDQA
jgi:DNA-binding MarR family transcriptional regulator